MKKIIKNNTSGFTLVELLAVMTIIAIISLIAIPSVINLQRSNKTKRFEMYESALKNAAKIYIDKNAFDIWGYQKEGCYKISYNNLKEEDLIEDFSYKGAVCYSDTDSDFNNTFVLVTKTATSYSYNVSLICKDADTVIYKKIKEDSNCSNITDLAGPTISFSKDGSEGKTMAWDNLQIIFKDSSKLKKNIVFKYGWATTPTDPSTIYQEVSLTDFTDNTITEKSFSLPNPNLQGTYYLKIIPVTLSDSLNNIQSSVKISKPFIFK